MFMVGDYRLSVVALLGKCSIQHETPTLTPAVFLRLLFGLQAFTLLRWR